MALVFVNSPSYNTNETIDINGVIVILTGTTAQNATDDINAAAVPGVVATNNYGIITLLSTTTNIILSEGGGTALNDLGFTPGSTSQLVNNLSQAIIDINGAGILGIFANNVGNQLTLTSSVNNLTLTGSGVVPFGLTAGTYNRKSSVANAIAEITAAAIPNIIASDVGGALNLSSSGNPSTDITLSEGGGTTLTDLGGQLTPGVHFRTSQPLDAVTDINSHIPPIVDITVSTSLNALVLSSSIVDITLSEGSGTTLSDLGFSAGISNRTSTIADAITDITNQTGIDIEADDNDGDDRVKITISGDGTFNPILDLQEGSGTALADLGFVPITRAAVPDSTEMDDVTDIVKFFTEFETTDIDLNISDDPLNPSQDLRTNDDIIIANHTLHNGEGFIISPLGNSVRTTAWGTQLMHQADISFINQDEARAYFNTGGELQLSANRTGGSATAHNAAWSALLNTGPYIFTGVDYFNLTTSFVSVMIFTDTTISPYGEDFNPGTSPNRWIIQAKSDTIVDPNGRGGVGNIISFRIIFQDLYVAVGPSTDIIDGIFTSTITENRAIGVFVKPQPLYIPVIELSSGS